MRLIHTADWHLGNQMHGIDRMAEFESFLRFLRTQILDRRADTLIVAGDIFDTANPGVGARRLYYSFLASLAGSCCKNVIIIGGNHDSAAMLDSARELLGVLNIRVVGSVSGLAPAGMCFELKGEDGETVGICMAVPFVREVELRGLLPDSGNAGGGRDAGRVADSDLYSVAYKALYSKVYDEAERLRGGRKIPVVATGHLYAADLEGRLADRKPGGKSDDGMRTLDVLGTLGNVPPSVFPQVDYVALGHVHYTTTVAGNPAVRYSGSPFVMGFDEADARHFVLCADIGRAEDEKSELSVEKIETPRALRYRRLSGTLAGIRRQLEELSASAGDDAGHETPLYLELCYKREIGVSAQEYLDGAIRALPESISVVSWKVLDAEKALSLSQFAAFDAGEIKNLDDREVFTRLILSKTGLDGDSDEGRRVLDKFLPLFLGIEA